MYWDINYVINNINIKNNYEFISETDIYWALIIGYNFDVSFTINDKLTPDEYIEKNIKPLFGYNIIGLELRYMINNYLIIKTLNIDNDNKVIDSIINNKYNMREKICIDKNYNIEDFIIEEYKNNNLNNLLFEYDSDDYDNYDIDDKNHNNYLSTIFNCLG